jgi:hypothetical protein
MANLTFDDGEPIDISKLQNLYDLVLELQGEVSKTTFQNQNVKETPLVYAGTITSIKIPKAGVLSSPAIIDYSAAKFEASARPRVMVTPRLSSSNVKPGSLTYFVTDVTSSNAKIIMSTTSKDLENTTIAFDYVIVHMRQTTV